MREVTIERLGRAGDGIAGDLRLPFALPGERWEVGAADPRLLAAAPERVAPPCPHFGTCGGCTLQHAADGWIAGWKAGTIARALEARGLEAEIRPTLTSPPGSRRRAVLAARRTRKGAIVGFHCRRSETLIEVPHCLVVTPAIAAAFPALARLTAAAASRTSTLRLTVTDGPAGLDVDVAGARALDPDLRTALAALAESADLARLSCAGEIIATRRPPFQVMGAARVVPPPGAFLQATAEGERALVAAVREAVGAAARVADLFAGCGTFALPLAAAAEVLAVEGDPAMPAALAEAARRAPGLRPVRTAARDLFRRPLLAAELARFDAVVIDPPRAGAEAQSRGLARSRVPVVAAVSCDPASFARDAAILAAGGYRLDWVQPVDQFRWSGHVELAARFSR
ncbi:MAG TPA: class I SAM-dependent RNA methyltransferase [Amaricoccus sp.]|nr:class I SAM-dependent RNA methyltransferase [Amaricoccus sp.]